MLSYLVKLNKKVDSLQKEIKDIKKTLQSDSRTMGEADDMYNKMFIKVNILFYLFFLQKKNYFTHNILKKRILFQKLQTSQFLKEYIQTVMF